MMDRTRDVAGCGSQSPARAVRLQQSASGPPDLRPAVFLMVPIAILAGLLGVGPGFLVLPVLIVVGAGSFLGARLTSRFGSGPTLKRAFGILIVVMTAVKVASLVSSGMVCFPSHFIDIYRCLAVILTSINIDIRLY